MEQEHWFCPNHYCATEAWLVEQAPEAHDLWMVTSRFGGTTFTVAATDPVCPHCGATLCARVELGQRRDERILQAGAMLNYVRSLR